MTKIYTNTDRIKKVMIVNPKNDDPYVLFRSNCTEREATRILKQFTEEETLGFDSWVVAATPRRLSRKFNLTYSRFEDIV